MAARMRRAASLASVSLSAYPSSSNSWASCSSRTSSIAIPCPTRGEEKRFKSLVTTLIDGHRTGWGAARAEPKQYESRLYDQRDGEVLTDIDPGPGRTETVHVDDRGRRGPHRTGARRQRVDRPRQRARPGGHHPAYRG